MPTIRDGPPGSFGDASGGGSNIGIEPTYDYVERGRIARLEDEVEQLRARVAGLDHDCFVELEETQRLTQEVEQLQTVLARAHNEGPHGVGCAGWAGAEMDPNRCNCWRSDVRAALAE